MCPERCSRERPSRRTRSFCNRWRRTAAKPTRLGLQVSLERRVGRRMHVSAEVPFYSVLNASTPKTAIGDVAIGAKRVVLARPSWPLIATAGASLSFPSGDRGYGLGTGTHVLWPFVAAASFHDRWDFQADVGVQIHMPKVEFDPIRLLMYNAALTRDLTDSPTTWNIGLQVNGIDGGLGLVPQIRLTRSGTLSAALGFRIPVAPPFPICVRHLQVAGLSALGAAAEAVEVAAVRDRRTAKFASRV